MLELRGNATMYVEIINNNPKKKVSHFVLIFFEKLIATIKPHKKLNNTTCTLKNNNF